ncbi:MAG: hypothetical protein V1929_10595 [bacterium]
MSKRPKSGDPELLLVSFCDIVTVTTAALFMAMVITIQEAMKVPELMGTPRAKAARRAPVRLGSGGAADGAGANTNGRPSGVDGGEIITAQPTPVYFECRKGMVFPVNYEELYQQTRSARTAPVKKPEDGAAPRSAIDFLNTMQNQEIGNDYYKVQPSFLMLGQMVLEARPEAKGETEQEVEIKGTSQFFAALHEIDKRKHYVVFLVRDDSFPLFKTCRRFVQEEGYESGWEYLDDDQLIKFGGFGKGAPVPIQ